MRKKFDFRKIDKKIGKMDKNKRIKFANINENFLIKRWWILFLSPIKGFLKFKDLDIVNLTRSKPGSRSKKKISSAYNILF